MPHDLIHCIMGRHKLTGNFGMNAGLTVEMDGTSGGPVQVDGSTGPKRVTLRWKDLICRQTDIILFAPPRDSQRPFGRMFKDVKTLSSVHALFRYMALEYIGDVTQSSLLFSAYNRQMSQLRVDQMEKNASQNKSGLDELLQANNFDPEGVYSDAR